MGILKFTENFNTSDYLSELLAICLSAAKSEGICYNVQTTT